MCVPASWTCFAPQSDSVVEVAGLRPSPFKTRSRGAGVTPRRRLRANLAKPLGRPSTEIPHLAPPKNIAGGIRTTLEAAGHVQDIAQQRSAHTQVLVLPVERPRPPCRVVDSLLRRRATAAVPGPGARMPRQWLVDATAGGGSASGTEQRTASCPSPMPHGRERAHRSRPPYSSTAYSAGRCRFRHGWASCTPRPRITSPAHSSTTWTPPMRNRIYLHGASLMGPVRCALRRVDHTEQNLCEDAAPRVLKRL